RDKLVTGVQTCALPILGDFGEVYVMDWGLAKVLDRTTGTALDTGPPMAIAVAKVVGTQADSTIPMATPIETPSSSAPGSVPFSRSEERRVGKEWSVG